MPKAPPPHRFRKVARLARGPRPESVRGLIEEAPVAVISVDLEGRVEGWNPAAERLFGWRQEEVLGQVLPHIPSEERTRSNVSFQRVLAGETIHGVELLRRRKDGSLVNVNISAGPLRGAGGRVRGAVGVFTDAPVRSRVEGEPSRFQGLFQALIDNAADVVALLDAEGAILYASPLTARVLGCQPAELESRSLFEFLDPEAVSVLKAALAQTFAADAPASPLRLRLRQKGGAWRTLEGYGRAVREPEGLVLSLRDITERRSSELGSRENDAGYRSLFERNPFPMWVYDVETLRFLAVNDAAVEHYGYSQEEFLGMSIKEIRPSEEIPRLLEEVARISADRGESHAWRGSLWRHRKKDGTVLDVDVRSTSLSFGGWQARLVLAKDVSVERRLESQLRQAHKMDAVGRLAGGVAHDFNNILGVITGYAELVQRTLPAEDPRARKLTEVLKAAERATALTRQLLAFSRQELQQPKVFNLNSVVSGMEKMLGRLIGENISLSAVPEPALWPVEADPGHIEQVLMNLSVNARDAMPRGGSLIIETQNVEIDETLASTFLNLKPGPHVVLSVSDTGEGMDADVQSHIFEPFFTTKGRDKGTGLGLSIVYSIVRQSRGHIQVYSHPGRGTTFRIYLPRAGRTPASLESAPVAGPPVQGSETILLVEDDDALRSLALEVLSGNGYTVLAIADGSEVASVAADRRIDLLLTDMMLRTSTGRALADQLKQEKPELKVLYMSGYTDHALVSQGGLEGGECFLQKPFTPDSLLRQVRALLDEPRLRR